MGLLLSIYRRFTNRTPVTEDYWKGSATEDFTASEEFFARLPSFLQVEDRRVMDVGCGTGTLVLHVARLGAARAVGVDADPNHIEAAKQRLADEFPQLADRVEFIHSTRVDSVDEQFDLILSKDAFEHFEDPKGMVAQMEGRLVPGGELAVGFGPFWRAPYGGHLDTKWPWLHLVFPTRVVAADFNADRPGRNVSTWQEMGIGKLTYRKFTDIMDASGLEPVWSGVNVSDNRAVHTMTKLRRVPGLRELMTTNIYGVWRKPAPSSASP
jgi:SAM-dependent methyltransferase